MARNGSRERSLRGGGRSRKGADREPSESRPQLTERDLVVEGEVGSLYNVGDFWGFKWPGDNQPITHIELIEADDERIVRCSHIGDIVSNQAGNGGKRYSIYSHHEKKYVCVVDRYGDQFDDDDDGEVFEIIRRGS